MAKHGGCIECKDKTPDVLYSITKSVKQGKQSIPNGARCAKCIRKKYPDIELDPSA